MKNLFNVIREVFYSCLPIKKNTAFFQAFFGMYSDNPKYISEELHRQRPNIEIYWFKSSKNKEEFPNYVKLVEDPKQYAKLAYCSQILVDNTYGFRSEPIIKQTGFFGKLRGRVLLRKRKKQYSCTTWHGTPLKHICADEPATAVTGFKTSCRCVYVGNKFTEQCMESALLHSYPIKLFGSARNDILFSDSVDIGALKGKLHIPEGKKILLYAPTFRNELENFHFQIDFKTIIDSLKEKFGSEWCIVLRVHDFLLTQVDVKKLSKSCGSNVVNGNQGDDMAEYFLCSDVLLTDYSSSMFDFALTGKPCFLLTPDREHYETEERGFYLDFNKLPFPSAEDCNALAEKIKAFDAATYQEAVKAFLEQLGNIEDGHAAERIVRDILEFIDKR